MSGSTGKIDPATLRARAAQGHPTPLSPMGWLRFALRVTALLLTLIFCVPVHYIWRTIAYGSPIPMLFLRIAARIAGARVQIVGTPLRRDVCFLSNHISWVDILALAGASGTAFVAKAELAKVPVIGWLCRLNRTVFVQREARMNIAQQINDLREALEDNWSITIFPEGTTTDGRSLLPFKTSMLRILEPPPQEVLVQPVALYYGAVGEEIGWIGEEHGINNAKRILGRKGSFPLRIHFLEPFSPDHGHNRKAIAARARAEIEEALEEVMGGKLRPFALNVDPVRYQSPSQLNH